MKEKEKKELTVSNSVVSEQLVVVRACTEHSAPTTQKNSLRALNVLLASQSMFLSPSKQFMGCKMHVTQRGRSYTCKL